MTDQDGQAAGNRHAADATHSSTTTASDSRPQLRQLLRRPMSVVMLPTYDPEDTTRKAKGHATGPLSGREE